jgi:hypothetical protein
MDRRAASGSLLRSFERHLRAQNRSERTVGNYLESARLADAFLEGRGKRLEQATLADLEDFVAHILRRRSQHERPGMPARLHPGEPACDPGRQLVQPHLPTGRRYPGQPRLRQGHHQDLVVPARYP